jgi:hypothetical protein
MLHTTLNLEEKTDNKNSQTNTQSKGYFLGDKSVHSRLMKWRDELKTLFPVAIKNNNQQSNLVTLKHKSITTLLYSIKPSLGHETTNMIEGLHYMEHEGKR